MVKSKETSQGYLYELDYIRAISAVFVMLYHFTTQYNNTIGHVENWNINFPWGAWAVNTFFLLSGYLTLRNYKEGGIRFLYKRFARLWPAFVVCVLLTSGVMFFLMPDYLRSVKDILLNFTMFPTYLGAKAVDGVYWTLPLEILFYFWIMVFMSKKLRPHLIKCLYGWMLLIVAISLLKYIGYSNLLVKAVGVLFVAQRGECFMLGCVIALWHKKDSRKHLFPLVALCFVNSLINFGVPMTMWTICWGVAILAISQGKIRFANFNSHFVGKTLTFIAGISYPLYLLHQYIGFSIIRLLENAGFTDQWWILVPMAIVVLLATAVHNWVELPAGYWLLSLENKIKL